jgi:membrane-bound lytic murein transglycosylase B
VCFAGDVRLDYVRNQLLAVGFDQTQVENLLTDNRIQLLPKISIAYKPANWGLVRQKLYSKAMVQAGVNYIKSNQAIFDDTQKYYGVPSGVIAGIMAIETNFGSNVGNYSVFNALYSRMEHWPANTWQGQAGELVAFSKYCLNANFDCLQLKGSYAGAIGLVQFMPDSILAYGVDGDKDGVVDLFKPADAIPSAANFLFHHGWTTSKLKALGSYYGSPVGYPSIVLNYSALVTKGLK